MKLKVNILDKEAVSRYLETITNMDKEVCKKMGTVYGNDPWEKENFLMDIKKKWDYSRVVLSENGRVAGFIVASEMLPEEMHIHRFVIAPDLRGEGGGSLLIKSVIEVARLGDCKRITVEASRENTAAVSFYKKNGFECLNENELKEYASKRKDNIEILGNFTRESDGSEFYILQNVLRDE